MWPPPLFRDRSFVVRVLLAVALPALFGALCGFMLGVSGVVFQILMIVSAPGGVGGGYEHPDWRGGALRGISGGVLFSLGLTLTFMARGVPAVAALPAPLGTMAIFYAVMGTPLGALGGWLRGCKIARDEKVRVAG